MIEKILYQSSRLFGRGPISPQDFREVVRRCAVLPLRDRLRVWGRLICLQPILKAIDQHIPVTEGLITDLGCGYGLVSLLVSRHRHQAIAGIEVSPSRLAVAKRAIGAEPQITLQHGDIARVPIQPSAAILLIDVLCLFSHETQHQILTKCRQALTRHGILLIKDNTTVPRWKYLHANLEERIKLLLRVYGTDTQKRPSYWPPQKWRHLINEANLKVLDECFIESFSPYPGVIYVCQTS